MKCLKCNDEVDIKKNEIPPRWYGHYENAKLAKLMCVECLVTHKEIWDLVRTGCGGGKQALSA
ncbi:MAG: hypothetical protein WCO42_02050 [bacterium]